MLYRALEIFSIKLMSQAQLLSFFLSFFLLFQRLHDNLETLNTLLEVVIKIVFEWVWVAKLVLTWF